MIIVIFYFVLSLIRGNNGRSHHDLAIAAGGGENRPATRLEPAVQRALFAGGSATTRAAPLQSRVANCVVVAPKRQGHAVGVNGGLPDCVVAFSLNVEFGVVVLAGPFFETALAIGAVCGAGVIRAA